MSATEAIKDVFFITIKKKLLSPIYNRTNCKGRALENRHSKFFIDATMGCATATKVKFIWF